MTVRLPQLGRAPDSPFPPHERALDTPDGLLAWGGDLSPTRLLNAYRHGVFPWFSEGEPLLWWTPSERAVFRADGVRLASRLRRRLRQSAWTVCADTAFDHVIEQCARRPRPGQSGGTWITPAMIDAYRHLHRLGHAHSIEVYDGTHLVGGLYGLSVGRLFCGESMFSAAPSASSVALAMLARHLHDRGWPLIDAQVPNSHTRSLGVETWPRDAFLRALHALRDTGEAPGRWDAAFGVQAASQLGVTPPA